ncbi:MAG: Mo-dependent nitrogenase C-terminal domain-containing protein [Cyanobacteriota bacterium]|nr:Mo-dependent nitrogenase C-terminal domain-containing protein [Cyanobacteriota bacterium]
MAISPSPPSPSHSTSPTHHQLKPDFLAPLRRWVDSIEVKSARFAHFLCRLIPCDCPFDRDITWFGRKLFHIPPLCELNPLYNEFVGLRFRALSYLADECGEDITKYIC